MPHWIWILWVWLITRSDSCSRRTWSANHLPSARFSANRVTLSPRAGWVGGGGGGGMWVSLARFQDLAVAHWKRSARKDAVQRGIHHLQHRLLFLVLSLSPFAPSSADEKEEEEECELKHKGKKMAASSIFFLKIINTHCHSTIIISSFYTFFCYN